MLISREKPTVHTTDVPTGYVDRTRSQCLWGDNERQEVDRSVPGQYQETAKWERGKDIAEEISTQLSYAFVNGDCHAIEFGAFICRHKQ